MAQRRRQTWKRHIASGPRAPQRVLVVDVGGTRVKCLVAGRKTPREFESWRDMTAAQMVARVIELVDGWTFDVVSIGYPGTVVADVPSHEPRNLGTGWQGFDFAGAFERPVKVVNDSAMQAYGAYRGGKMLFLGLGTGLGTAMIVDGLMVPMELAHLPYKKHATYEDRIGKRGLARFGEKKWLREVAHVIELFRDALQPEYIVLGGGNAKRVKSRTPDVELVDNSAAFVGGFRLWEAGRRGHARLRTPRGRARDPAGGISVH